MSYVCIHRGMCFFYFFGVVSTQLAFRVQPKRTQVVTSDTNRFVDRYVQSVTIVSLVLKDASTGIQAGTGFVSTRKYIIKYVYAYV